MPPMYYTAVPGAIQTTNAAPLTANDCVFFAPGATRTFWLASIYPEGRGAGLTSISGITYRLEKWFTTASSGGTAFTKGNGGNLEQNDPGYQNPILTGGFAVGTVTSGTGGPSLLLSIGSGTTSPGNWMTQNLDFAYSLPAAATQSLDIFNASGTASLNFELSVGLVE
jgi:hypothetical protein